MENETLIAPSVLSADFSRLGEEIAALDRAGADLVHFDVMDGVFVPNITMGPCVIRSVRNRTKITFDVHLMIDDPVKYVKTFAEAGADIITFHIEACKDPGKVIRAVRDAKKKAGISLRPGTQLSAVKPYLDMVDMVLVMTVEPGFGGQSFMADMLPKIAELKGVFSKDIEVDGGINFKNAADVIKNGANILVAGTTVFGNKDYKEAIRRLKGE